MSTALYSTMGDFWDKYQQRLHLATFWSGLGLIYDNEYLQVYQGNLSKTIFDCPVFIKKQWVCLELDEWVDNLVPHEHYHFEFDATAAQEEFFLLPAIPPELDENLAVFMNGVRLTNGIDYIFNVKDDPLKLL
jgi:hypothetical protein